MLFLTGWSFPNLGRKLLHSHNRLCLCVLKHTKSLYCSRRHHLQSVSPLAVRGSYKWTWSFSFCVVACRSPFAIRECRFCEMCQGTVNNRVLCVPSALGKGAVISVYLSVGARLLSNRYIAFVFCCLGADSVHEAEIQVDNVFSFMHCIVQNWKRIEEGSICAFNYNESRCTVFGKCGIWGVYTKNCGWFNFGSWVRYMKASVTFLNRASWLKQ